eukprot:TRINITY_DN2950_c0_g1_i1.p1 TRINITY_DN2950_c0_g1~~TRINITY_DN2950_c0_g1_i1.p1  ORF type:complete len:538 (+),score=94.46 TRINITY_DN2950_c0_g1_i1:267-1880(+)
MEGADEAATAADRAKATSPTSGHPGNLSSGLEMCTLYKECQRNQAACMGGQAVDGCGEFMPAGEEGTPDSFRCAACDCHRNFHRRVLTLADPALSGKDTGVTKEGGESGAGGNAIGAQGENRGEGRPTSSDFTFSNVHELAQVARLSMQALEHNTKVMMATADSLNLLQQQRGLEIQEITSAFERAAAAMGLELRRGAAGGLLDAAAMPNKLEIEIPNATRAMDSEKSMVEQEARRSQSPELNAKQQGRASHPSEKGIDGATSILSAPAFFPQNHRILDNVLMVQGAGGIGGGWGDGQMNGLQGGTGHLELGMGTGQRGVDSNRQTLHMPGILDSRFNDPDAMLADMLTDGAGQREEGAAAVAHSMHQVMSEEARTAARAKTRGRSRRGRSGKAKRIRTKLTQEQKEKMEIYAEKVGWTVVGQRKEEVEVACADIGIGQKTLRYWLHNTKQKMKQPHQPGSGATSQGTVPVRNRDMDSGAMSGAIGQAFGLNQRAYNSNQTWGRGQFYEYDEDLHQGFDMSDDLLLQDQRPSSAGTG